MINIFCDMDGTIVDFNRGIYELFGKHPDDIPDKIMWPRVMKHGTFFRDLHWLPDGKNLWNYIKIHNPTILTGQPSSFVARDHKREWCAKELGDHISVIVCKSKEKYLYGKPGDLLIDDREDVLEGWRAMGGRIILHRSAENSIIQLKDLGI